MPKDPKKIQALYNAVSKDYDVGTLDEFSQKLDDPTKRQALYNTIGKDYDLGDYNTFNSKLGFDSQEVKENFNAQQPQAPQQPPTDYNKIVENTRNLQKRQDDIQSQQGLSVAEGGEPNLMPAKQLDFTPDINKNFTDLGTAWNVKPEEAQQVVKDFPYTNNAQQLQQYANLKTTNPIRYNRQVAAHNSQIPLAQAIRQKETDPQVAQNTINQMLMANGVNPETGETMPRTFEQARAGVKTMIDFAHKYIDDGDLQKKVISNVIENDANNYGGQIAGTDETLNSDPNKSFLNRNEKLGLQFLEDTDPATAQTYQAATINPENLTSYTDANGKKVRYPVGDIEATGLSEQKAKLAAQGIDLRLRADKEHIDHYTELSKTRQLTPDEINDFNRFATDATSAQKDLEKIHDPNDPVYGKAAQYEIRNIAQELGQQNHGLFATEGLKFLGEGAGGVNSLANMAEKAFSSDENAKRLQLRGIGQNIANESNAYVRQANQPMQTFAVHTSPELQKQIDAINNNKGLTDTQKQQARVDLLSTNHDWYKQPIDSKFNLKGYGLLYGAGDAINSVGSFLLNDAVLGGLGNVSKAKKAITTFGAVALQEYDKNVQDNLRNNVPNPYENALTKSAINAASMVVGEKVDAIKALLKGKAAGELVDKLSDDEILNIAKSRPSTMKQFGEGLAKGAVTVLKANAQMVAAGTAGQIANDAVNGELKSPTDYFKQAALQFVTTSPLALLGIGSSIHDVSEVQKHAWYDMATKPEQYTKAADDAFKNGSISDSQLNTIKDNIEAAASIYNKTDFTSNKGKPLSDDKKADLLLSRFKEEGLKEQASKSMPEARKEKLKEELENHKAEQEQLYVTPNKKTVEESTQEPAIEANAGSNTGSNTGNEPKPTVESGTSKEDVTTQGGKEVKPISETINPNNSFRTMDMGNDEGTPETKEARAKMKERFLDGDIPMDGEDGKGETGRQFANRVINEWEKIKETEPHNSTVITHSSVLKAIKTWEDKSTWDGVEKPTNPSEMTAEQWKAFAEHYNKESTDNGDLETFKGKNGDLHVIRHGQTEDNKEHNFRSAETQLTDKGREQAIEVGDKLKEKTGGNVPKIISSDLPRAIDTSNIIHSQLKPEENATNKSGQNKDNGVNSQIPKQEKEKTVNESLKEVDETQITDPHDKVLHYFANDGKIHSSAINEIFGGKDERIRKNASTENEKRARVGLIGKNAPTIDELAHKMWESDQTEKYDTQDYKNAIEQVLQNYNSKSAMAKDLVDRYDIDAAYDKYYSQFGDEFKNIYDNLSEDDINHLLQLDSQENSEKEVEQYFDNLKNNKNAITEGEQPEGNIQQHQNGDESGQATETSSSNQPISSGQEQQGEERTIGVSHANLTDLANKLGLKEPERGAYLEPSWYAERGRQLLKGGADPNEVFNPANELHDRIAIARAHLENLYKQSDAIGREKGTDSDEYKKAEGKLEDYANNVVKKLGTLAHRAFTSLQGKRDIDTDSFSAVKQATTEAVGGKPSAEQEAKIKDLTETNKALKQKLDEAEAKLKEALDKEVGGEKTKRTIKEKSQNVADAIRKGKLNKPDVFSAATPASLVWDSAIEIAAKAVEAGGDIAQAIADGIKSIKESDWYKGLTPEKQKEAEDGFTNYIEDKDELTRLQKQFADKTDNKFTPEEAKDIWEYARDNYLDDGMRFTDAMSHVSNDLGLTIEQINHAITTPKTKPIVDAVWKRNRDYQRGRQATENWIDDQNKAPWVKALKKVSGAFRGLAVFGHGGIFVGTHAAPTLFQPSTWHLTLPAFFRGWKYAYGDVAKYERAMADLKNRPNYVLAQRAGLKNDPDRVNAEEYQKSQKFLGKLGMAGEKGFNAIKVLRQDLFDWHYNKLSDAEKADPNSAKNIAHLINNATGATNLDIPEWLNEVTFAGGMEASRWGKITRNPAQASSIALKAIFKPNSVTPAERVFAKVWGRRVGEQVATYASLLAVNAAIQSMVNSKNKTNIGDPSQNDWGKFKFGDFNIDPTSGMLGVMHFMGGLAKIPFESKKERHGDNVMQAAGKQAFGYGRGKLSPFYGTLMDLYSKEDFYGNTLPYNNEKPAAGKQHFSGAKGWLQYGAEKLPLPVAETFTNIQNGAQDAGMEGKQASNVIKGIMTGILSGATGLRVSETKEKPTPYTDADNKKPVFKYFLDKGISLPNTANSSEVINDEKNATKKTIADFPKPIQDKYEKAHKDALENELKAVLSKKIAYEKVYDAGTDKEKKEITLTPKQGAKPVLISKLSNDELTQILSEAQSKATKIAKYKVFGVK